MDVRAAVAHKASAPLMIETVKLEGPKAGEVLVEIKATGICHTDEFTLSGGDPEGIFPAILGHEGAGIVVLKRLGDALRDGDRVLALIRGAGLSNDIEGNLLSPKLVGENRAGSTASSMVRSRSTSTARSRWRPRMLRARRRVRTPNPGSASQR